MAAWGGHVHPHWRAHQGCTALCAERSSPHARLRVTTLNQVFFREGSGALTPLRLLAQNYCKSGRQLYAMLSRFGHVRFFATLWTP